MNTGGQSRRTAHRCLCVLLALLVLLAGGCASDTEIAPPRPNNQQPDDRAALAVQTLSELARALQSGDEAAAGALAAKGSEGLLRGVLRNAHRLHPAGVTLRYVDDETQLSADQAAEYPARAWVATVQLGYRLTRWDPGPTQLETTVVLVPEAGRQRIAGFGAGAERTPVWLTGGLVIRSAGRVLVLAADAARARRLLDRGRQAVADVDAVLPDWSGRLVLVEPASASVLEKALDAEPGQYDAIAGVTSSVDGALVRGAPVHVWFNPDVFDRLGAEGSQVVVSHEATHVATGATFSAMPKWLSEGFADYVALRDAGVPLGEAAGQILARVRKHGPPDALPSPADLDSTANGLGATYEEAWLACRFLAQEHGEDKLVAFYRAVDHGLTLDKAFRQVLGTSQEAFVKAWSRDTDRLARETSGL